MYAEKYTTVSVQPSEFSLSCNQLLQIKKRTNACI